MRTFQFAMIVGVTDERLFGAEINASYDDAPCVSVSGIFFACFPFFVFTQGECRDKGAYAIQLYGLSLSHLVSQFISQFLQ